MTATARAGRAWPALLLILGLALAVRLVGIDYSLWYDEIASTRFADVPVGTLWSDWMVRETNPPLYYTLLGGWSALFGDGDAALRAMSVAIGLAGVLLAYTVGRTVAGVRTGLVAAGLLALSAQHVLYSQQVRGYVLSHAAALLAVWGALLFLRGWDDARVRRQGLAIYAAGCTVALYSHTTLAVLPLLANLYVAARFLRARPAVAGAAEWVAANALALLLWAWWAWITVLQATGADNVAWIAPPSVPYAVRMTLESYVPSGFGVLQLAAAALAAGLAGWGAWATRGRGGLFLATLAAGAPAVLLVLSLKLPVFLPRTVYWAAGPFLVLVAAGIAALPRPAFRIGAGVALLAAQLAALAAWWPAREIEPWRAMVRDLAADDPDGVVVTLGKGPAYAVRRYCEPPACRLRVRTMPFAPTDRWASGFAPLNPLAEADAPALLRREGRATAVRWTGADAGTVLAGGRADESRRYGPGGSVGWTRWAAR